MPTPTFNIGKDGLAVFTGPYLATPLQFNFTKFRWSENTKQLISMPLNSRPQVAELPGHYTISFDIDRNNNTIETLLSQRDQNFWALNLAIPYSSIFFYITEVTGALTTVGFSQLAFKVTNGGEYQQEDIVKQTMECIASQLVVQ